VRLSVLPEVWAILSAPLGGRQNRTGLLGFLWALAPLIAFAAEIKEGVGIQSLMTFMVGFTPLLVFLSSFANKQSVWGLKRFDFICGVLSLFGLFLWYATKKRKLRDFFRHSRRWISRRSDAYQVLFFPRNRELPHIFGIRNQRSYYSFDHRCLEFCPFRFPCVYFSPLLGVRFSY